MDSLKQREDEDEDEDEDDNDNDIRLMSLKEDLIRGSGKVGRDVVHCPGQSFSMLFP